MNTQRGSWILHALAFVALCIGGLAAADSPRNDFRFVILGDRTGDAQPGVYEKIWSEVEALHPDLVINVGDTIQGGNDLTAAAEWSALRPLWNRYGRPIYFTPGNHDIWSPASRAIWEQQTGHPPFYSFDYQNAHFTVLDNSRSSELSEQQMQFLAHDLAVNHQRDPKFVFFHQPFWLIPVKFQNSQFPFQQLVAKYQVAYVISGHGHQYVRASLDGVTYLEAPSSGGKLKGKGFDQGWFYGQVLVTVQGSEARIRVNEVGAPFGEGRVINGLE